MNKQQVVLATENAGKIRELRQMLADSGLKPVPQSDFNTPTAIEDGLSFVENALTKARNASRHSGLPAIADDSGITVDALDGAPGVYSARYAGENSSDAQNMNYLLENMKKIEEPRRTARFICLLVYIRRVDDPTPIICQGSWEGRLLRSPRGENGFGYDPVFYVPEKNCTSAQLRSDEKNALSHRGKALQCLVKRLGTA